MQIVPKGKPLASAILRTGTLLKFTQTKGFFFGEERKAFFAGTGTIRQAFDRMFLQGNLVLFIRMSGILLAGAGAVIRGRRAYYEDEKDGRGHLFLCRLFN